MATRSPTANLDTFAPVALIVPAISWPRIIGSRMRTVPNPPWLK
jgi:hypothetical protein